MLDATRAFWDGPRLMGTKVVEKGAQALARVAPWIGAAAWLLLMGGPGGCTQQQTGCGADNECATGRVCENRVCVDRAGTTSSGASSAAGSTGGTGSSAAGSASSTGGIRPGAIC
jgi:hypothetical protein